VLAGPGRCEKASAGAGQAWRPALCLADSLARPHRTTSPGLPCENLLYGFKAARRAARAADSAPVPSLTLPLPLRPGRRRSAGAKRQRRAGPRKTQRVAVAAADLTREPSRRLSSG